LHLDVFDQPGKKLLFQESSNGIAESCWLAAQNPTKKLVEQNRQ
jgi:hypothetical protein